MTLVPIIYTSLLIFSAVLVFVILVSYISYKAKGGNKRTHLATVPISHQHSVHVQHAPIIIRKERPIISGNVEPRNFSHQNNYSKQVGKKHIEDKKISQYPDDGSSRRQLRQTREDRIAIMNNTVVQKAPVSERKTSIQLNDANLLNYYSDIPNSEFLTLTA
jgi:hypothetical protein